ncbi:MAG: hypothetical protein O9302_13950 [Cyclobacteriaceae bacterium]|jgi:hypothetical protein|nr:hypothetical protein [Flammeovirgaceae bacterium]MCZ8023091.1 hypothetical protein [Cytophagales bacterium]MCZ8329165.1 hypothetical protein [Cyclobacteriaceae bacterium]
MEETKSCLLCRKKFYGRSDKRFCSNACRYEFNNQKRVTYNEPQSLINTILRKNRNILAKLCPGNAAIVTKETMINCQFNFEYFTNIQVDDNRKIYYFCYDFVYIPFYENEFQKVRIVRFLLRKLEWDPWKYVKQKPGVQPHEE